MSTKANWPEKMSEDFERSNFYVYDFNLALDDATIITIEGRSEAEAESRARQICALPKMVELLKELDNVVLDRSNINNKATNILREIGEIDG